MRGSCLCGGVSYAIEGPVGRLGHCHCSMCRKAAGAAFWSSLEVPWTSFRWLTGEPLVARYPSSRGIERTFCSRCGATLQFVREGQKGFALAAGTLDDDPGVRPDEHIYVASKAPWFEITDNLPQFEEDS